MLQVGLSRLCCVLFCFVLFLETEFHYIIKLSSDSLCSLDCPLNSPPSCLSLPSVGITDECHHTFPASGRGFCYLTGQRSHKKQCRASQAHSGIPASHLCSLCSTIRQLWQVSTSQVSQKSLSTSCVCRGQYKAKSPGLLFTPVREDRRCGLLFTKTFLLSFDEQLSPGGTWHRHRA